MDGVKKHVCKVCGKRFPTGRSLGGHVRSHAPSVLPPSPPATECYGLRENPKKSSRFYNGVDDGSSDERKRCKDCGKGFPSWRSLFGHMRCHSAKLRRSQPSHEDEEEDDEDHDIGEELEEEGSSDETKPVPAATVRLRDLRRPRPRLKRMAAIQISPPSPREYENEQKDVALSLIMLSRDARMSHCAAAIANNEPSDKSSINLQNEADQDQRRTKRVKSVMVGVDNEDELEIIDQSDLDLPLKKNHRLLNSFEDKLRGRDYSANFSIEIQDHNDKNYYECMTCNKIFDSYRALGGHKASHKRIPSCNATAAASELSIETISIEPSLMINMEITTSSKNKRTKIIVEHKCEICRRSFASGQALGGHKRSHLLAGKAADDGVKRKNSPMAAAQKMFDLNLPAQADEA